MIDYNQALSVLTPLVTWTIGLVIYGVFTFKFYRYLAQRDILELNLGKYRVYQYNVVQKFFAVVFWLIEFAIAFPVVVFFWFAVLALLIAALSSHPLTDTALVSMALVASVRITAYWTEDLSRDLAKMLPFALLGVFLIDASVISIADQIATLPPLSELIWTLTYYLVFIVAIELVLRLIHVLRGLGVEDSE